MSLECETIFKQFEFSGCGEYDIDDLYQDTSIVVFPANPEGREKFDDTIRDMVKAGVLQYTNVAQSKVRRVQSPAVIIPGVGPDAPVTVNEKGAKQSATDYRTDLLPPFAALEVSRVLGYGAVKYGDWDWLNIESKDHLNHALTHIFAHLAGDTQDDHRGHAACRIMMWLDRLVRDEKGMP